MNTFNDQVTRDRRMGKRDSKVYTIDIGTARGLAKAEAIQARMYNLYHSVIVYHIGFTKVRIECTHKI